MQRYGLGTAAGALVCGGLVLLVRDGQYAGFVMCVAGVGLLVAALTRE